MEITIKIDPRSKQAKAFLEYLKELPFVQIEKKTIVIIPLSSHPR